MTILFCVFCISFGYSQNNILYSSNKDLDFLYAGIENKFKVIIEGKEFEEIKAFHNNTELIKDKGFFILNPNLSNCELKPICNVYIDGIEKPISFIIKEFPKPEVTIYPYTKHYYSGILKYLKIFPQNLNIYTEINYDIKGYNLTIIKKGRVVYSKKIIGKELDKKAIEISKNLNENDVLKIDSVEVLINNALTYYLSNELVINFD